MVELGFALPRALIDDRLRAYSFLSSAGIGARCNPISMNSPVKNLARRARQAEVVVARSDIPNGALPMS